MVIYIILFIVGWLAVLNIHWVLYTFILCLIFYKINTNNGGLADLFLMSGFIALVSGSAAGWFVYGPAIDLLPTLKLLFTGEY